MNADRVIAEALRVEGMCGCKPYRATFAAWLGACQPGYGYVLDKPYGKGGKSLCSRATDLLWYHAGLSVPKGMAPPWDGKTFVRTHTWPEGLHATGDLRQLPGEGCAVWTPSHFVGCVVSWADPWDTSLPYQDAVCIEGGGQCLRDDEGHEGKGLQAIKRHHRRYWPDVGKGAWIADVVDGKAGAKSKVLGWVDVERLPHSAVS